jgi:hypothetical protein
VHWCLCTRARGLHESEGAARERGGCTRARGLHESEWAAILAERITGPWHVHRSKLSVEDEAHTSLMLFRSG